jgi:hypothetical protein
LRSDRQDDTKRAETMEVISTRTYTAPFERTDEKEKHFC